MKKTTHDLGLTALFLLATATLGASCNAIFGIDQAKPDPALSSGSGGHGGMSATSGGGHGGMSAASGGGHGGMSSSSSSGSGGPGCMDGMKNGSETDVDCGGGCPACGTGKMCGGLDANCASMICSNNVCVQPGANCSNKVKDGNETDVDCGGPDCAPCADNKACKVGTDCQSLSCKNGVCAPATCADGTKNGSETDIDCGGSCAPCADGLGCAGVDKNCQSHVCTNSKCAAATCMDGLQNGLETDKDCGGPTCPKCGIDQMCGGLDANCASMICTNNKCAAPMPSCMDGIQNGGETDIDCGGVDCAPCADGKMCGGLNSNCQSQDCKNNKCAPISCMDGLKNGTETGVDCGGSCMQKCPLGQGCNSGLDCQSGFCNGNSCQSMMIPTCMDGVKNGTETGVDCGGPCVQKCPIGQGCNGNIDCQSGFCSANICVAQMQCMDLMLDGAETDVDCGGGVCPACVSGKACNSNADCASQMCMLGGSTSATSTVTSSTTGMTSTVTSSTTGVGGAGGMSSTVTSSTTGMGGAGGMTSSSSFSNATTSGGFPSSSSSGGFPSSSSSGGFSNATSSSGVPIPDSGTPEASSSDANLWSPPENAGMKGVGTCL